MSQEHVLLICPPGFSYHLSIKGELESLGFAVTWWSDRGDSGTLGKIALRLLPGLWARLLTPQFLRRLEPLKGRAVTRVLVVKGEGVSIGVVRALKGLWPAARLSLYLWDSIDNVRNARRIAPLFDAVASFDPIDARRHGWAYRPLFARRESAPPALAAREFRFDWCFIGTLHSDRYRVIERLRRFDPDRKVFVFCYVPSRLLLALRLLSDRALRKAPPGSVSTRAMPAPEVAAVCAVSKAMLDVEHPRQRGLTMRSIETLLSATKLITTNEHIRESDLYDPTRVHVVSREAPEVPPSFYTAEFNPLPEAVRVRYGIRRWLLDLIGEERAA